MSIFKKIWELMGDEVFTMRMIALACVPLTIYDVVFCPELPFLNGVTVVLNMILLVLAFDSDDYDDAEDEE